MEALYLGQHELMSVQLHKGTCPLSRCYYDKFVKKYCRTTIESLLNQFNSGNSHLSGRTFPDN